jgi:hypothetical protein
MERAGKNEGGEKEGEQNSNNPLLTTTMHYGDLIYLHVESVDGYLQSSG